MLYRCRYKNFLCVGHMHFTSKPKKSLLAVYELMRSMRAPNWKPPEEKDTDSLGICKLCKCKLNRNIWVDLARPQTRAHWRMEAVAKHDFNASADDELSFRKGSILKVRSPDSFWPRITLALLSLGHSADRYCNGALLRPGSIWQIFRLPGSVFWRR